MEYLLRKGAMTPAAIAEEIESGEESIRRVGWRYKELFLLMPNGRMSLLEKRVS